MELASDQSAGVISVCWVIRACLRGVNERIHDVVEILEMEDSALLKRQRLINCFLTSRQALIRLLVLIKYIRRSHRVIHGAKAVSAALTRFDDVYVQAYNALSPFANNLHMQLYHIWDVCTSIHTLRRGSYNLMPRCIDEHVRGPVFVSEQKALLTFSRLENEIRMRLLRENLPTLVHSIAIREGNAEFWYGSAVQLSLSIRMMPRSEKPQEESERIKWILVSLRFHIADERKCRLVSSRQLHWLKAVLSRALVVRDDGLTFLFETLDRFVTSVQMEVLQHQAAHLSTRFKESPLLSRSKGKFSFRYWSSLPALSLEQKRKLAFDGVELSPSSESAPISIFPVQRPELRIESICDGRKLLIQHSPDLGPDGKEALQVDSTAISFSGVLERAISLHTSVRLLLLCSALESVSGSHCSWERLELRQEELRVYVFKDVFVCCRIERSSGLVLLSSANRQLAAGAHLLARILPLLFAARSSAILRHIMRLASHVGLDCLISPAWLVSGECVVVRVPTSHDDYIVARVTELSGVQWQRLRGGLLQDLDSPSRLAGGSVDWRLELCEVRDGLRRLHQHGHEHEQERGVCGAASAAREASVRAARRLNERALLQLVRRLQLTADT